MAEIAKLAVTVDADMRGMQSKLNKLGPQLKKIGIAAAAMGAAVIASVVTMTKQWAEAGDEIQKMSLRTKWSTESLSELRYVAEITGTELNAFEKSTRKLNKSIVDAADGLETYMRDFEKLGLSAEALKSMKPEEAFWVVAQAISEMDNEIEQSAVALNLFGRQGTQLFPMFAEGADGIKKLREEAHELGWIFDQEAANKAASFNDALTTLKTGLMGVGAEIASDLAPVIENYTLKAIAVVKAIKAWAEEHPELIKKIVILTAVVSGLLLVLMPLLFILPLLGVAFTVATGPVGLIIAAILALGAVIMGLTGQWQTIISFFTGITGSIKEASEGVKEAIVKPYIDARTDVNKTLDKMGQDVTDKINRMKNVMKGVIKGGYRVPRAESWYAEPEGYWTPGKVLEATMGAATLSMQHGGIVPGPIGQPVPIIAHAGETVTPVGGNKGGLTVNINVAGSVVSNHDLVQFVREELYKTKGRTYDLGLD